MNLVLIVIGIGIFALIATYFETKKRKENIQQIIKTKKCTENYNYYKKPMLILSLMIIPCLIGAGIGFVNDNKSTISLGILLSFLFLAEVFRTYYSLRIYYNDQGIIIDQKYIRYKSIKSFFKNSSLPFSKWTLLTFNNEKISVDPKTASIVQNYLDNKKS